MAERIIVGGVFKHPDEHGGLLCVELVGLFTEVDVGGSLDSDGIVEKVEAVEIHVDNLILRVETFELDGDHPFDRLLHRAVQHIARRLGIKLFCQLLGDGRSSARRFVAQGQGLYESSAQRHEIDA